MKDSRKKCRLCRREGVKLYLKGDRCNLKCSFQRRNYPPGSSPKSRQPKSTEYGKQLRNKQRARWIFNVSENTMSNYYKKATKSKKDTSNEMMRILEMRLDNVVHRSGFAKSIFQARQFISHGFFLLNKKNVDIPSIILNISDKIELVDNKKKNVLFIDIKKKIIASSIPKWMSVDFDKFNIDVIDNPGLDDFDVNINAQGIVEFYSR